MRVRGDLRLSEILPVAMSAALAPLTGWLKLLEELSRGRWEWRLYYFSLQEQMLVFAQAPNGPPAGMVSLSVVSAVRCGPVNRSANPSSDLTVAFNDDDLLRMRAPDPVLAACWLAALRNGVARATGRAPPTSSPSEAAAAGASSIEAAALTADDPQAFPPEESYRQGTDSAGFVASHAQRMHAHVDVSDNSSGPGRAACACGASLPTSSSISPTLPPHQTYSPRQAHSPPRDRGARTPFVVPPSPEYGSRFGPMPWPTACTSSDLRPTHERYSYSPAINAKSDKLSSSREGRICERLYEEAESRTNARVRMVDGLDLHSFDYALRAGLEVEGKRGDKERSLGKAAKSRTLNERMEKDGNYTFAPHVPPRRKGDGVCCGASTESEPAWERLYARAAEDRRRNQSIVDAAEAEAEASLGPFAPELSARAKALQREGYVEDRLIDDWARRLAESARLEAEAARQSETDERPRLEARRQSDGPSVHDRLYATAADTKRRIEARRQEIEGPDLLERWDGSRLPAGDVRITKKASANATATPARSMIGTFLSGGSTERRGSGESDGGGEAAHDRLHRRGSQLHLGRLNRDQDWEAVVAERMHGKAGTPARSAQAEAIEAHACERLWEKAQDQQRRQRERESGADIRTAGQQGYWSSGTSGVGHPSAPSKPSTPAAPPTKGTPSAGVAKAAPVANSQGKSRPTPRHSGGGGGPEISMSLSEAESRGAQMHFEAMVRLQQKEELVLHAQREAEAQAAERMSRTVTTKPAGVTELAGDRLYQQARASQAKLERLAVERQQALVDAETVATPLSPRISSRAARTSDGRPVHVRVMDWHDAKQSKLAAAGATVSPVSPGRVRGKPRTVDDI